MERQLQHMVRLIDDLLDLSRISRDKIELQREVIDLGIVLQNAVETSRPLIEQSQQEFKMNLSKEPICVNADLIRLAQVFSNLLNNAAKYTAPGGHISLSVIPQTDEVAVSIKDNGIGIPAETLPHVFDMFTQAERPLEKTMGGLGVGLSIVRRLVE